MKKLKLIITLTAAIVLCLLILIYYKRYTTEQSLCETYINDGKTALYLINKYKQDTGIYPKEIEDISNTKMNRIFYKKQSSRNEIYPYLGVFYDEIYNDIVIHYDFEQKTWISSHEFEYYKCPI